MTDKGQLANLQLCSSLIYNYNQIIGGWISYHVNPTQYLPFRCVLRIAPSDDRSSDFPLSEKFGCSVEEAWELLTLAKQYSINVMGVRFVGC